MISFLVLELPDVFEETGAVRMFTMVKINLMIVNSSLEVVFI